MKCLICSSSRNEEEYCSECQLAIGDIKRLANKEDLHALADYLTATVLDCQAKGAGNSTGIIEYALYYLLEKEKLKEGDF